MTELAGCSNFYVIVGSSAGALIGLQFVVMTLISDMNRGSLDSLASGAFSSPSIVHFGVVLLLSAIVSAPWKSSDMVVIILGFVGFCGVVYCGIVLRRIRQQSAYKLVLEDWLFHLLFPLSAYSALLIAAIMAQMQNAAAMYSVAAGALILLFVGIHNAWDTVTYHLVAKRPAPKEKSTRK
jgi:hypothetical protein